MYFSYCNHTIFLSTFFYRCFFSLFLFALNTNAQFTLCFLRLKVFAFFFLFIPFLKYSLFESLSPFITAHHWMIIVYTVLHLFSPITVGWCTPWFSFVCLFYFFFAWIHFPSEKNTQQSHIWQTTEDKNYLRVTTDNKDTSYDCSSWAATTFFSFAFEFNSKSGSYNSFDEIWDFLQ